MIYGFILISAAATHPGAAPLPTAESDSQSIMTEEITGEPENITVEAVRQAEETLGNPESDLYDEAAFCEVLRKALDADILGEADRLRAEYRLEIAEKNKPGSFAADFMYVDREGVKTSLHEFESSEVTGEAGVGKPVLLIFYDPDCDHCVQTIRCLRELNIQEKADVIAIYAEDDRDRWEETAQELPSEWTVGFALDPIQDEETYVFITSPTLYLLDKDKKVILKDAAVKGIAETLRNF